MRYEEDTRRLNDIIKYRVKCECSHSIIMSKADRTICSYCGRWVYRTPQIKFKYKIKESLIKEAKNDN
jgi:rRNA maturation endonuclease Nob1